MDIITVPAAQDNYMYLIVTADQSAAVVDPCDARRVEQELAQRHLALQWILVTHHHYDHIAGIEALKEKSGARVIAGEDRRIPAVDQVVSDGGEFVMGQSCVQVMATPGHGDCDISFLVSAPGHPGALLCGDTLFVSGCGRILEGSAEALWQSLQKIKSLPDHTLIFCGHEYTEENLRFACHIQPEVMDFRHRLHDVQVMRQQGQPTVPSTMANEKMYNPFLQTAEFADFVGLRQQKDRF